MRILRILVVGGFLAVFPGSIRAEQEATFLTGPQSGDAAEIALSYVRQHRVAAPDGAPTLDYVVKDQHTSPHNKLTHIYLRRTIGGMEVFGDDVSAGVSSKGEIVSMADRSRPVSSIFSHPGRAPISPEIAVQYGAAHLGLPWGGPLTVKEIPRTSSQEVLFYGGDLSGENIPVKLMFYPDEQDVLRLVWNFHIQTKDGLHWWHLNVDAVTGAVLYLNDWVWDAGYRVFALPGENPDVVVRTLEADPHDPLASPFGWHDTDGAAGAEHTVTRGNNVDAHLDVDANNLPDSAPDGGAGLVFDFPLDLSMDPSESTSAGVANLFYWNNILHDIHYQYGFTEAAGNFQVNNYGRGGSAGDPVQADALDGSDFNNANMFTPPDGFDARMQMFVWLQGGELFTVLSPSSIAGVYSVGIAEFGARLDETAVTGTVVLALDPPDPPLNSVSDACSPITNGVELGGNIALIDRGECLFVEKVKNAQNLGAIAVVIINNAGDDLLTMAGEDATITIPSVFIGQTDGEAIKAALSAGVDVAISGVTARDSSLDNGIIVHEYGHGVSTRLTGGRFNSSCLGNAQSGGMGEGWGDWWALVFTASSNDIAETARPVGAYATGNGPSGPGIRNFSYTTDVSANPLTYDSIIGLSSEHAIGEVWCVTLWDMYWKLVARYGFDPDLYHGAGGNNVALQLVMDGLKLQPCEPSFLEARDAILMADVVNNAGANQCLLWEAFARRGMGTNALDGGSSATTLVSEGFTVPDTCRPTVNSLDLQASSLTLTWTAESGTVYRVEAGSDPSSASWQPVADPVSATGSIATSTLTNAPAARKFFRVSHDANP
jgi:hypothetical protein